ncbi:hypothetical protein [Micromonospora sp. WMMD998]|uniref:hypothetical protein n=1 Tax=Micromonospora sp. WMMD998 TaxID=3016092 RepID=UPI00249C8AA4|nr:hypothetical protein [Micromonospora sp. WMMD998]WFE41967.1 hypothetical protein O7619_27365 [Micromonospora sp. WMMD998]
MTRKVPVTVTVRDRAGNAAAQTLTWKVKTAVGMEALNGEPTRRIVADFPNLRYMRDFGVKRSGEPLPSLTAHGAGKFADMPGNCVAHVSWKTDVERLGPWLDGLARPVYLTWYHEPMGDVVPAAYRSTAARVSQIVAAHRNRRWVLGHGPIVTRYWLDEGGGNPTDWGYPGMTHYGVDCYSQDRASYWPASRMFGVALGKVRAAYPGVRLWVPEYGRVRTTADNTGAGRAQAVRSDMAWLTAQSDVDAVGYYNNAVDFPQYAITAASPEGQAWRDMQSA